MNTQPEDRLRRALRSQAERGAPHEIDLDSVTATARGIRRRRTALAAFSTAAVIALAVPAGMAITGSLGDDEGPPVAGQSPNPTPIEPPNGKLLEVSLLDDLETGGEPPSIPFVRGASIVAPGGDQVEVPGQGRLLGVDVLGEQWLVLKDIGEGNLALDTVTPGGDVVDSVPARSGPVMSSDGTVAAYVAGNGDLHTITASDGDLLLTTADRVGGVSEVGGVLGSGTCKEAESDQGGCTVVAELGAGGVRYATSHGIVETVPGYLTVSDINDGRLLGMVSADDFGSCSALRDLGSDTQAWRSCDNSFGAISPDGRFAIGYPSYTDGLGAKSFSLVSVADGRELVRFADTGDQTMTTVFEAVWESDSAMLVTLWDGEQNSWRLLRAGLDGSLVEVEADLGPDRTNLDDPAVRLG